LAEVRIETAWILEVLGELDAAEQLLYAAIEAAVEGRSAHLESRSWRQLVHLVGLERHDLSQALVLAKVARIAERRTGLDPEQPTHLDITMAAVFAHHGRFDEAIVHHERALAWSSGKPGEASALNNFGVLLVALGRRSEARRAFERGLALRLEQELADEHAIAETRQNLADLYVATGEPATALEVYAPVLAVMETAEGPHSPGVARVRSNMAVAYLQLGKFDDARREAEHALEIAERTLDQGEILAAAARISLAELDLQANALDAAAAHLVIAEEILRTTLGADHPALGEIEVGRAQLELARGSPEAARTRTAATLERLETSLGPEHADLSRVLVTLGHAELQTGQTEAATRTLERALAIFARSGGPLHEVGRCRLHLAQALNEGGKDPGRAAALFEQAEKDLRAAGRGNVVEHARAEGRLEPHPGG
jgi:tetratricopeptide (TPR) repeat protein